MYGAGTRSGSGLWICDDYVLLASRDLQCDDVAGGSVLSRAHSAQLHGAHVSR